MRAFTIATRQSPLALWQANWVKNQLNRIYPDLTIVLKGMTTEADRKPYVSLGTIGGKGLFVKELETCLLSGEADIAVHSIKDMPMILPTGLVLDVICERDDVHDAFVSHQYENLAALPHQAVIGTSSLRRQSQLLFLRPDLIIKPLRGNVNSRLEQLAKHDYDALILAAAGLKRLGMQEQIRTILSTADFIPAVGQGALGLECREDDTRTRELIQPLHHLPTAYCVNAERAMCLALGGGCQLPIAGYANINDEQLALTGFVGSIDGKVRLCANRKGDVLDANDIGIEVAEQLLSQGAAKILQ